MMRGPPLSRHKDLPAVPAVKNPVAEEFWNFVPTCPHEDLRSDEPDRTQEMRHVTRSIPIIASDHRVEPTQRCLLPWAAS